MINIQKNNYVQPTEVREAVVQGICEAFLNPCCWHVFHPHNDGMGRGRHRYIVRHKKDKMFYGFHSTDFGEVGVKFNGAEMKRAFEELQKAGYYMFRIYTTGWMGYVCSKTPFYEGGVKVTSFDEFVDY